MQAPHARRLVVLAAVAMTLVGLAALPGSASAATCPTFRVLHNDKIGRLQLPQGEYQVTTNGLSCAEASDLFAQFLEDWDGRLPSPWRFTIQGVGRGTFLRGTNGPVSFSVVGPGAFPPPTPPSGLACQFPFTVLHNDRIGALRIPEGRYRLTRLSRTSPTCQAASGLFTQFLQDWDGRLPNGWVVIPSEAAFVRNSLNNGFRIKGWAGPVPSGGNTYPSNETRCGGTFRVLHNDRIGNLRLPRGPYWLNILGGSRGLNCSAVSSLFRQFLTRFAGNLPRPWVLDARSGTFRKGRGSSTAFRVKPDFQVR